MAAVEGHGNMSGRVFGRHKEWITWSHMQRSKGTHEDRPHLGSASCTSVKGLAIDAVARASLRQLREPK